MVYYLSLFFLVFLFSKLDINSTKLKKKFWLLSLFLIFIVLGSRYYIGGDYFGYANLYEKMNDINFDNPYSQFEFIYYTIILVANKLGLGYFLTNFIFLLIFLFFLEKYLKKYPNPFFVLFISIPILLIPISINFMRQAIAISIFLFSINFLIKKDYIKYIFYIFVASFFHKFALIYLVFYFVYEKNYKNMMVYFTSFLFIILTLLILIYFLQIPTFSTWKTKLIWTLNIYLDQTYPIMPKGVYFRLALMALSFLILIYFKDFFKLKEEYKLWFSVGIISIFLIPMSVFFPLATSRLIIFFVPITIFVFGHVIFQNRLNKIFNINLVSLFFLIYFLVWINFSPFKSFFIPYKSILFL